MISSFSRETHKESLTTMDQDLLPASYSHLEIHFTCFLSHLWFPDSFFFSLMSVTASSNRLTIVTHDISWLVYDAKVYLVHFVESRVFRGCLIY